MERVEGSGPGLLHGTAVREALVELQLDVAVEGGAQQPAGVGEVGLGEAVGAQHTEGQLDAAPPADRVGDLLRVELQLGRGVPARVGQRELAVGVGEGDQRVLAARPATASAIFSLISSAASSAIRTRSSRRFLMWE